MKQKYRLTHGKFHEIRDGNVTTFRAPAIIELSPAQAQLFRNRIEGPVSDELSVGQITRAGLQASTGTADANVGMTTVALPTTPEGQALEDVKLSVEQLKDHIRTGNVEYLTALQQAEAAREGGPRTRVFELIERRKKGLAEPAA